MLLKIDRRQGLLNRQIYEAVKAAIHAGRLAPGARLPSSRALAGDLRVSRNTVTLAYEQLAAEGYVVPRSRSAPTVANGARSSVSKTAPTAVKPSPRLSAYARRLTLEPAVTSSLKATDPPTLRYDFRYGRPAIEEFPHTLWRKLIASRIGRIAPDRLGYAPPAGYRPLREALTGYLARARGLSCTADQIVIVHGSQQAFDLIARVLIDPGDTVVVEDPHYHGSRIPLIAAGAKPILVPVDCHGLAVNRLAKAAPRARLACVTPCHQFPTGVIMPLARRLALLDWAARADAYVIEDDYVSEFRYEGRPIEALQALDHDDRVIYVGTFSKTLFPALRLAYIVLPRALVPAFTAAKWAADRYSSLIGQEALTEFITGGQFERYLRRASTQNAARRRAVIAALHDHFGARIEIAGENAGVHLLVWLKDVTPHALRPLIDRAARVGVGIYPATMYYARPPKRAALLLGYAALSETAIRAGIRRLAEVF